MKVKSADYERIVRVTDSPGVYIDDRFYHDHMGEDTTEKQSFPVNVVAMRIDWILNRPEGRDVNSSKPFCKATRWTFTKSSLSRC